MGRTYSVAELVASRELTLGELAQIREQAISTNDVTLMEELANTYHHLGMTVNEASLRRRIAVWRADYNDTRS